MNFKFITIEGNIGSGKTSLAKKIAYDFSGKLILEKFADNPFLPNFYKDAERHAFPLELFFMAERFQQLSNQQSSMEIFSKFTITDYSFFKSKLFAENNLKHDELNLFHRLYNIMFTSIRKPEIIVYLHSDIERLQRNILKRGRDYEQNISDLYLQQIEDKYFDYFKKQNDVPVLMLDITKVNFIKDKDTYEKIVDAITNFDIKKEMEKKILS